jgi:drug/metabolite transporter (DMT)-like permease
VGVLLGLASAITYGAADFLGGFVTRRTSVFSVMVVSQLFGTSLLFVALPFFLEDGPTDRALIFGALAGIGGAAGVGLFYKGLSIGRMSVLAPVTAVLSASFPVLFGLLTGDRPEVLALGGVVLAVAAVALISSSPGSGSRDRPAGLPLAFGAGIGFGLFFILLAQTGEGAGLWPLVSGRLSSLAAMVVMALVARRSMRPAPGTVLQIGAAGVLDVAANIFYLLSTRHGLLSIVAVVTSLYPASTVVLARFVLHERLGPVQVVGLGVAAAGVSLIALS